MTEKDLVIGNRYTLKHTAKESWMWFKECELIKIDGDRLHFLYAAGIKTIEFVEDKNEFLKGGKTKPLKQRELKDNWLEERNRLTKTNWENVTFHDSHSGYILNFQEHKDNKLWISIAPHGSLTEQHDVTLEPQDIKILIEFMNKVHKDVKPGGVINPTCDLYYGEGWESLDGNMTEEQLENLRIAMEEMAMRPK
jgi:hypothetical protein